MKLGLRTYIVILAVVTGLCSCSEEIIINETQLDEDLLYVDDKLSPYTGKCRVFYSDSDLTKEILSFRKGRLQGEAVYYYRNGNIKWKGTYKNGYISGTWEFRSENGEKMYEANYHNDTLDGEYRSWYLSGAMKECGTYINNKKKGDWQIYNEKGEIIESRNY